MTHGAARHLGSGAEPPSSLDTLGTTRQRATAASAPRGGRAVAPGAQRAVGLHDPEWRRRVAASTADVRERRAERYDDVARSIKGKSPSDRRRRMWYESRAKGERERFERADACGQDGCKGRRVWCKACGVVHGAPASCGSHWACPHCRNRWIKKLRKRFLRARSVACRIVGPRFRGHGAWSEKFVTLTVPHVPESTAAERIRWCREAWPIFLRELRRTRYVRTDAERARAPLQPFFYRVLEWEPGADGRGHPHHHVWWLGPWFDHATLERLWRNALVRVGMPQVARVVVDVRRIHHPAQAAAEVCKYLTKDQVMAGGMRHSASPEAYGAAYGALTGRRRTQGSSGFLKLAGQATCPECGDAAGWRVELLSPDAWRAEKKAHEAADQQRARASPRVFLAA